MTTSGRRAVPTTLRRASVALVVVRLALPFVAVPLIPLLVFDRIELLVLLRPQKEFLLRGGAQARLSGAPSIAMLLAAYVPFMLVAVWAFFVVGRAYRDRIRGDDTPRWLRRALPPARLELAQRVLAHHGAGIAVLGRLAAFPPTILAAAAGISDVDARRYLGADLAGALSSFALAVGAGWALGETYARAGIWLTAAGLVVLAVLVALLTRWLRRERQTP
jgi:membrane protein DedA with SNARE-associated domain